MIEKIAKILDELKLDEYYVVSKTTIVIGRSDYGYWVADNGWEVNGLSKEVALTLLGELINEDKTID
jgi:hypothetical protein